MASSMKSDELPVTVNDSLKRQEQPKGSAAMTKRGVYAAASYMASAVLLVMFNKAALSSYSFPCANVITLFQMFCSCSILYALRCWKIISFTVGEPQTTSNNPTTLVPLKTLVHTLPLALSYLLYMLITMEAVRGINVPMYTTLRRTTVAFTMIVEYLLTGQKHSLPVVGSVGIILLGAFLAGAWDLSFDAYGYAVVFIANICTAAYLAFISRIDLRETFYLRRICRNNMHANSAILDFIQRRPRSDNEFPSSILPRLSGPFNYRTWLAIIWWASI
ncbi:UDP-N-acetylglucosamine transporter UGNT1-like isoform X3 [Citrus sinensis]|uniref:UDP-N-acetylglucosamine transporter UGNT1-like isoform X3 n=1 Tax=Citrus sinensis TaxID=2711 RepID=UPI002278CD3B|nr:UDP-N-acetylglucosamine transporter UGNT1-like isoform X3 [Citrus sinensis]